MRRNVPLTLIVAGVLAALSLHGEETSPPKLSQERTPEELAQIQAAIRKKLSRKVSFEFVETPFEEALNFLNSLAKVGIVIDPGALKADATRTPITLKVTDMELDLALSWICRLADLRYEIRDRIFITSRTDAETIQLEIYDLRGLVRTIGELGWVGPAIDTTKEIAERAKNDYAEREKEEQAFLAAIKTLDPNGWNDPMTSMEESGGKLIVMQTRAVHAAIAEHLAKLRKAKEGADKK